ncbi:MAG: MBL fold metallo-hydrolase, partial [Clostridia bacterium]|nr:MBL fold metallo-hydrolase [Clostridia bacterium]
TKKKIIIDVLILLIILLVGVYRYIEGERAASLVSGTVEIHIIDVGQADSVLVKTDLGNLLIDAGSNDSEQELINYLDSLNVSDFEYCIFTHPHEDHIGGADVIMDDYDVRNVIVSPAGSSSVSYDRFLDSLERSNANVIEAVPDSKYMLGELEIFIMGPIVVGDERDANNSSVVTRLSYGANRMLFTGDAEKLQETDLLEKYSSFELDADFLKAGHHGSSTSNSEAFLKAVSPSLSAISCGDDNSYGHPHREVIMLFEKLGVEYQRTDEFGDIVYVCNGKTIKLKE